MEFSVEVLTPDFAADWLRLRREGARDFPLGFLITEDEAAAMTPERAGEVLAHGGTRGVFHDGQLIGFCGYRPQRLTRTRHRAEIGPFYVTPAFHGAGAAKALIAAMIAEARAGGVAQLELFVDTENEAAIRF